MGTVEQLLVALRGAEPRTAAELRARLGVSQPTLSRLVKSAGDRICRLGAARASRYTLTRELPVLGRQVPVWRIDESGRAHRYGTYRLLTENRCLLEREVGADELFSGLPPVVFDMSPKGYLGRGFPAAYPDLNLPRSIRDWNDDHVWIAVARRGEDCAGNFIVGRESFDRFLNSSLPEVSPEQYPARALPSAEGAVGSSAAGEQPKFAVFSEGRHVLVKFASRDGSPASQRWCDLLAGERLALEVVREAGHAAAAVRLLDVGGLRFLEVERFDRVGERGRRGLLSLQAIDAVYLGGMRDWTEAAECLLAERKISLSDARHMVWLDVFGQLTANDDRHSGNLSFFTEAEGNYRPAPVYDMLPMLFAPSGTLVVEREFRPASPTASTFEVWADAAQWAIRFWECVEEEPGCSASFRNLARRCRQAVLALSRKHSG